MEANEILKLYIKVVTEDYQKISSLMLMKVLSMIWKHSSCFNNTIIMYSMQQHSEGGDGGNRL